MPLSDPQATYRWLRDNFPYTGHSFEAVALAMFRYQAQANPVYAQWISFLNLNPAAIILANQIPYLPISLFKTHTVTSRPADTPILTFLSSRTTGQQPSQHRLYEAGLYQKSVLEGFKKAFGEPNQYFFLSLLPSYGHAQESSLVYMVQYLAQKAGQKEAVTLQPTSQSLKSGLDLAEAQGKKALVFGVTHALLAMADGKSMSGPFILIETGGMKGRGKELTRSQLHNVLAAAFTGADIRSEYGMTELFSQGYTLGHQADAFVFPAWVQAHLQDPTDLLSKTYNRNKGVLALADLANLDSCAFISTSDLAEKTHNGWRILGRQDHAEIRGCNLLTL